MSRKKSITRTAADAVGLKERVVLRLIQKGVISRDLCEEDMNILKCAKIIMTDRVLLRISANMQPRKVKEWLKETKDFDEFEVYVYNKYLKAKSPLRLDDVVEEAAKRYRLSKIPRLYEKADRARNRAFKKRKPIGDSKAWDENEKDSNQLLDRQ